MLLTIDAGNTNVHFGLFEAERLLHTWELRVDREWSHEESAARVRPLLETAATGLEGVAIACVVPALQETLRQFARTGLGTEPEFLGEALRPSMPICYDSPSAVGADRLVAAVAAVHQHGAPLIVGDFGTATTLDAVSPRGEFLGGTILPGIGICMEALARHAPHLPAVELRRPESAIGSSTLASLQSGAYHGFLAQVEGLVRRLREALGAPAPLVATGGFARVVAEEPGLVDHLEPHLTLEGLRLVWLEKHCSR